MRTASRDVELVTSRVPSAFVTRFLAQGAKWWVLIIVSPWITPNWSPAYTLDGILQRVREQGVPTYVITRPPAEGDEYHARAVALFRSTPSVELRFNRGLHAKILLAEGPRHAVGLLGSANLTMSGMEGVEVGVLMHSRGIGEVLIRDLIDFCTWDLRRSSVLIKSRERRSLTV